MNGSSTDSASGGFCPRSESTCAALRRYLANLQMAEPATDRMSHSSHVHARGYFSLSKGEGQGEGSQATSSDNPKPLTLVLSPCARGEATKASSWAVCISSLL